MQYGIISNLDEVTTLELFRSKRVTQEHVVHINAISNLMNVLKSGDVVHVVNVNRFASVYQFWCFGRYCMSRGVSLRILAQPYLDIGRGKQWKPAVIRQIMEMLESERLAKGRMAQCFKLTNEQWDYVYRCFELMNLDVLSCIFSTDGVLKHGS